MGGLLSLDARCMSHSSTGVTGEFEPYQLRDAAALGLTSQSDAPEVVKVLISVHRPAPRRPVLDYTGRHDRPSHRSG